MKASTTVMLVAGFALALSGCQTPQQVAKNQSAAQEWLNLQTASAGIGISGNWMSEDWGNAKFKQNGRQVTGTLDTYEVKGVVSGGKAYLTTWDSGKCYYAIILSSSGKNVLKGSFTDGPAYINDPKKQRPMELRRTF